MRRVLIEHQRRYPEWALDDLYKLIHQATMGAMHAGADEAAVRKRLDEEIAHIGSAPKEPLLEPISPDGDIMRVHLRPLVRLRMGTEDLLQAFIRTSKETSPSRDRFVEFASVAVSLCAEATLRFEASDLSGFLGRLAEMGLPAMHHSALYEELYRPAYRVVARRFLPGAILAAS